jgi:hypothetical protein
VSALIVWATWGTGAALLGAASPYAGVASAVVSGAALGAATSATMTAINGGSWRDILKSGLQGAISGAINGLVTFGIGSMFGAGGVFSSLGGTKAGLLLKSALHGGVGGLQSIANGGDFKSGFLGSFTSSAMGGTITTLLGQQLANNVLVQGLTAALIGGTASVIGGGSFTNGATSAAFTHLYNFTLHELADFFAGAADNLSFGITRKIREYGDFDNVDRESAEYSNGGTAGTVLGLAAGGAGAAKLIVGRGAALVVAEGAASTTVTSVATVAATSAASSSVATATAAGSYSVYLGYETVGAVRILRYVGITMQNPMSRFAQHLSSGTVRANLSYDVIQGTGSLTKIQARIIEQTYINTYGLMKNGGQLYNKINSIAERFWTLYGI